MITTIGKIRVICGILISVCLLVNVIVYRDRNMSLINLCDHEQFIKLFDSISFEKILYKQCNNFRNTTIMASNRDYGIITDIIFTNILELVMWMTLASFASFIFEVILDGERDKIDDFANIHILKSFGMSNMIIGIIAPILCILFASWNPLDILGTICSCAVLPTLLILSLTYISHNFYPNVIYGEIIKYYNPMTANVDEQKYYNRNTYPIVQNINNDDDSGDDSESDYSESDGNDSENDDTGDIDNDTHN